MNKRKVKVLSTRHLPVNIIEGSLQNNIQLEVASFIRIEEIEDPEIISLIKKLGQKKAIVIFTSTNAVKMVSKYIPLTTDWKIYCIGKTTKGLIDKIFGSDRIAGIGKDSLELSKRIISDKVEYATFFCGDIRRDELPDKLKSCGIKLDEMIVYKTIETPVKIKCDYSGILFFSPSAVKSFFKENKLNTETVIFSIGNTTNKEIKRFTSNPIITSKETDKESLVAQMISYYSGKKV